MGLAPEVSGDLGLLVQERPQPGDCDHARGSRSGEVPELSNREEGSMMEFLQVWGSFGAGFAFGIIVAWACHAAKEMR